MSLNYLDLPQFCIKICDVPVIITLKIFSVLHLKMFEPTLL